MLEILFVLSFTGVLLFIVSLFGKILLVPFLHYWGVTSSNCYIYTPCILFQVWYWSTEFNLI